MAYQVIARKWRPRQFDDVVGQGAITRALQNALRTGRLHHAYLFAGPRGVGKTTCARLLARALNCVAGPTPHPCGECPSCRETMSGDALDVLEIDAASHTGVDNIREVILATVGNRPARDRYRVFIIDEVHMLSTSAFNALLKTLEEPPAHVMFILATTELHKLPETILSRCQQYEFRTIGVEVIADRLERIAEAEKINISRAALIQIAHAGRGSLRDAQSAFDQVLAFTGSDAVIDEADVRESLGLIGLNALGEVVAAIAAADAAAVVRQVEQLIRAGHDLRQFLRELMTYLRHLLVAQVVGLDRELLPVADREMALIERQCRHFTVADLVRLFSLVADLETQVRASEDARPLVEVGLVKLTQLGQLKPLEDLLTRLNRWLDDGLPPAQLPASTVPSVTPKSASTLNPPARPSGAAARDRPKASSERPSLRLAAPPPEPPSTELIEPSPANLVEAEDSLVEGVGDPTNADELLTRLKKQAEKERRLLSVHLDSVRAARWQGNDFELLFGPGAKAAEEYVAQPREKIYLRERLQPLVGRVVNVVTRLDRDQAQSPVSEQKTREIDLRAEAERHPAVKEVQKSFGAELLEVKLPLE
ncbi:MAG: DNA polymerase III subunit gamma/tau [Chloracidobacterium sp.]